MKPTLLILAAGLGSRYGGIKQMDKIGPSGENIIDYSIYDAILAGFGKVVFVINKKIEKDFIEIFEPKLKDKVETLYVLQEIHQLPEGFQLPKDRIKPWGTAHAILSAKKVIKEPFAVINADDFYGRKSYKAIVDFFERKDRRKNEFCMIGFRLGQTITEYGSVSRGVCSIANNGLLKKVMEHTHIQKQGNKIIYYNIENQIVELDPKTIVSMNVWGFTPILFEYLENGFKLFLKNNINDSKSEYYIPNVVTEMIENNIINVKVLESTEQWFGITYKEDKFHVMEKINHLISQNFYPKNLWE